jgi:hypothetical protein
MTDQELNTRRLAAWDNYESARQKLAALKGKIMDWGREFRKAADRCAGHPLRIHENEFVKLPSTAEIAQTIADARTAMSEYKQYRTQAAEFRFPVEADQTLDPSDFDIPQR